MRLRWSELRPRRLILRRSDRIVLSLETAMNEHSPDSARILAEQALLFCSTHPAHSLSPFIRAKALAVSRNPADPSAYLELRVVFGQLGPIDDSR